MQEIITITTMLSLIMLFVMTLLITRSVVSMCMENEKRNEYLKFKEQQIESDFAVKS